MERKDLQSNKQLLFKYAGLGTQMFIGLILAAFAGKWIDTKLNFHSPIAIWLFPLIFLLVVLFKVVKDTSPKK